MDQDDASRHELEAVREAHEDWCAEQSIDPASPLGQEALLMMVKAFRKGAFEKVDLVAACDAFMDERQRPVRLGAPAIPSVER
jgi:hypothetical protein